MESFDAVALRLKQELKVKTDKAVAEALGLSQRAWIGRRSRGSFPETELLALKAKRPDLDIDVTYVITGQRLGDLERRHADHVDTFVGQRGDPSMTDDLLRAREVQVERRRDRQPRYDALMALLDGGDDETVDLFIRFASKLRVAPSPPARPDSMVVHGSVGQRIEGGASFRDQTIHVGGGKKRGQK